MRSMVRSGHLLFLGLAVLATAALFFARQHRAFPPSEKPPAQQAKQSATIANPSSTSRVPKDDGDRTLIPMDDEDGGAITQLYRKIGEYSFQLEFPRPFLEAIRDVYSRAATPTDRINQLSELLNRNDLSGHKSIILMYMADQYAQLKNWGQFDAIVRLAADDLEHATFRWEIDLHAGLEASLSPSNIKNVEPYYAYLDSIDDYKKLNPEVGGAVALYNAARGALAGGDENRYERYLTELSSFRAHADRYGSADREFQEKRLRENPRFALHSDLYFIRVEDVAALELALHVAPKEPARAIPLLEALIAKQASVPNFPVVCTYASLLAKQGRAAEARILAAKTLQELEQVRDRVPEEHRGQVQTLYDKLNELSK